MIIPQRMKQLRTDKRGYPVPFNVLVTSDDKPHFTINDHRKVSKAAKLALCGICGQRLFRGERWFVGGPMSAFSAHGAYLDGPLHHECGTFALQTCPFLAAPRYGKRIDDATVVADTLGDAVIITDPTVDDVRPELFVFACASDYKVTRTPSLMFHPKKPWLQFEFWVKGAQLTEEEARPLLHECFERHGVL
jgi:hypothetical protein